METLHFERYEYKYLVPEERADEIRRFIRPYAQLDKHAADSPDQRYTIHNIYLDTPTFDLYGACIRDDIDRFKLRIRWYDAEARGPFFTEVKRRIRNVIVKDRARLSRRDFDAVVTGKPVSIPDGTSANNLTAFQDRVARTGAIPALFSRYTREPYESVFGEYSRITIDRAMCYQMIVGDDFCEDPGAWTYVDGTVFTKSVPHAMLIELKFTRNFPRWMSDLVAEFDLVRCGYSKFVCSVTHNLGIGYGGMDYQRYATVHG